MEKLFERITASRIVQQLSRDSGLNLHKINTGSERELTINAILRVRFLSEQIVQRGGGSGVAIVVSLDIVNAFNFP